MLMVIRKQVDSVDALRELFAVLLLPLGSVLGWIATRHVTGASVLVVGLWPLLVAAFVLRFVGALAYGIGDGVRAEVERWIQ